jgi:hypothetical protein
VEVKVASASSIVNRVTQATRLDEVLPLYPTVEKALALVHGGAMPGNAD